MRKADRIGGLARGTWIEPEDVAYDRGQVRRGRAVFPDGKVRAFRAGVADTYFSIPAHARVRGIYIAGYVTVGTASESEVPTDEDPAYYQFRVIDRARVAWEMALERGAR